MFGVKICSEKQTFLCCRENQDKNEIARRLFSREVQKQNRNKNKKITPALDRTGVCLLKVSDNLNFFKIEDSLSVSNNQCLKYFCRQCVSSEDIIFTVHIGYNCLRGFHEARKEAMLKQQRCTYVQLLNILLVVKYCIKVKDK